MSLNSLFCFLFDLENRKNVNKVLSLFLRAVEVCFIYIIIKVYVLFRLSTRRFVQTLAQLNCTKMHLFYCGFERFILLLQSKRTTRIKRRK